MTMRALQYIKISIYTYMKQNKNNLKIQWKSYEQASIKRWVFSFYLIELKSSKSQSSRGSLFHSVGAATENDLSPKVRFVFWDGNASKVPADDERKL